MKYIYMSFVKNKIFVGAVIIKGADAKAALEEASNKGLNPGGQAAFAQIEKELPEEAINRLLSREELEQFFGPVVTIKELKKEGKSVPFQNFVHEKCNIF